MPENDAERIEANLESFYGNLRNYVRMVTGDYSNLLMLDAKGGLGKTYHVLDTLDEECEYEEQWVHQKGFTTPVELYKTLWQARADDAVLFLDDMSGVTSNTKAIDMLKAATETNGDENWVQYRTSREIDHPFIDGETLPNTFCFQGRIIISFNDTPDNHHFDALRDRGIDYHMSFTYQERLEIINELAKDENFSTLSVDKQIDTAKWISQVTDSSFDVTIRSFEEVLDMREFAEDSGANWEKMAYEIFDMDYQKHRIIEMRESMDMTIEEQVEKWCNEFGMSESTYYDKLSEVKSERM